MSVSASARRETGSGNRYLTRGEERLELRHLLGRTDADEDVAGFEDGIGARCHFEGPVQPANRDHEGAGHVPDSELADRPPARLAVGRHDDLLEAKLRYLAACGRGDVEKSRDLRLQDD